MHRVLWVQVEPAKVPEFEEVTVNPDAVLGGDDAEVGAACERARGHAPGRGWGGCPES